MRPLTVPIGVPSIVGDLAVGEAAEVGELDDAALLVGQRARARRAPRAPPRGGRPRRRCAPRPRSAPRCPRRWRAGGRARWRAAARRSRGCARCRGSTCARSRARGRSARSSARATGTPPARRPRRVAAAASSGRRARRPPSRGARRRPRRPRRRPRRTSCMRSSSARWRQGHLASRHYVRPARRRISRRARQPAQQAAGLVARRVQRALGELEHPWRPGRVAPPLAAHAQDDERRRRRSCRRPRPRRAAPSCAGRASRRQLPGLELVGGHLGEARQRRLEALGEVLGRLDGRQRAAQEPLEVRCSASLIVSPALPGARRRSPRAA